MSTHAMRTWLTSCTSTHAMLSQVCYRFSFAGALLQKFVRFMLSPWLPSAVRNPMIIIFVDFDSTSAESHEISCCLCLNWTKQLLPWLVMANFHLNFVATNALFLPSTIFLFSSDQMAQVLVLLYRVGNLCSWHYVSAVMITLLKTFKGHHFFPSKFS